MVANKVSEQPERTNSSELEDHLSLYLDYSQMVHIVLPHLILSLIEALSANLSAMR